MNEKIEKVKKETNPKRKIFLNCVLAFLIGGVICVVGQLFIFFYEKYLHLESDIASIYSVITMVFLGSLLTGLGIYDKIGQIAGCGTIIPITGFANSMTSSALESKSEGVILGIINNMFKLAGSVIVVGVVSGVVIGAIRYLFGV